MTLSERAAKYNNRQFTPQTRKAQDEAGLDFHPGLRVGAPAPDFTVHQLDGTTLKLSEFSQEARGLRVRLPHSADLHQRYTGA